MSRLREKSILLTSYLEYLICNILGPKYVSIITPTEPKRRGCQLSLIFTKDVSEISKKLQENGVICDIRKPNVLRVAPTPLYNRFLDVWRFVQILKNLIC